MHNFRYTKGIPQNAFSFADKMRAAHITVPGLGHVVGFLILTWDTYIVSLAPSFGPAHVLAITDTEEQTSRWELCV